MRTGERGGAPGDVTGDAPGGPPDGADWHEGLRRTFRSVARGRVPAPVVDDLVHDALAIVYAKGFESGGSVPGEPPSIAWCLTVLRNVIGNHYRKDRRRDEVSGPEGRDVEEIRRTAHGSPGPTPLEMLERHEVERAVADALAALREADETCAGHLARIAAGVKPVTLADEHGLAAPVFYRRLYRCRQKLARLLEERGVTP